MNIFRRYARKEIYKENLQMFSLRIGLQIKIGIKQQHLMHMIFPNYCTIFVHLTATEIDTLKVFLPKQRLIALALCQDNLMGVLALQFCSFSHLQQLSQLTRHQFIFVYRQYKNKFNWCLDHESRSWIPLIRMQIQTF